MSVYKCCWNCANGFTAIDSTKEKTEYFARTQRFCFAPRPVSEHSINPYQKRSCKQFEDPCRDIARYGHLIDRSEAEMLFNMSKEEQVEYWERLKRG